MRNFLACVHVVEFERLVYPAPLAPLVREPGVTAALKPDALVLALLFRVFVGHEVKSSCVTGYPNPAPPLRATDGGQTWR